MTSESPADGKRPKRTGTLLEQTRRLLRRSGLRARKRLGQHFLIDEEALGVILSAADIKPDDLIIEVGPGLGVLTVELAERAGRVIALELDDNLADLLENDLSSDENVSVINEDVLKISPADIIGDAVSGIPSRSYKVVANLPYYITSPVLRHFLESDLQPEVMVVMVQKEVAEEITAKPGKMSLLSIGVQLYGEPEIITLVPAASFYPPPEVNSAVLRVVPHKQPIIGIDDRESFFVLVRAGFSAARKQLANSLMRGLSLPKNEALALLEKAGIEPTRRAESLSLEEWSHLWKIYSGTENQRC
ncbi:16S rRNA (adenine(1518)-N(6)/adenine(1519)-N(6))-dimethyltransferase RsmA [Chloroflexota bacterium]